MTVLVLLFAVGAGLGLLPWRPVAVGLGLLAVLLMICRMLEVPISFGSWGILMVTALLLGWACGLLIVRTKAERAAR